MNPSATRKDVPIQALARTKDRDVKYVFICGLHRSGTTILAQQVGQMKNCTGFGSTGAGLSLDEGQYLQDVYPPDTAFGGVGRFGFRSEAHLTEESSLLTPENIARLRQSWEKHWDKTKTIRIEKTPSNLLKTRFLQAAFPNACFILIRRHPVVVSLASQKWSRTPLHDLFDHWLRCHQIFEGDKKYLERVYELSYEDYVRNPDKSLESIADFIGAAPCPCEERAQDVHNTNYLKKWDRLLQRSLFKRYYRQLAAAYEERFARYGYSLAPSSEKMMTSNGHNSITLTMGRYGSQIYGVLWRTERRWKNRVKRIGNRYFPNQPGQFSEICR